MLTGYKGRDIFNLIKIRNGSTEGSDEKDPALVKGEPMITSIIHQTENKAYYYYLFHN